LSPGLANRATFWKHLETVTTVFYTSVDADDLDLGDLDLALFARPVTTVPRP